MAKPIPAGGRRATPAPTVKNGAEAFEHPHA